MKLDYKTDKFRRELLIYYSSKHCKKPNDEQCLKRYGSKIKPCSECNKILDATYNIMRELTKDQNDEDTKK